MSVVTAFVKVRHEFVGSFKMSRQLNKIRRSLRAKMKGMARLVCVGFWLWSVMTFYRSFFTLRSHSKGLLLEWILQNMVRHFVTHKQVQADKRHPI